MSIPLSLFLRPKNRTPLGELKVSEEKNTLNQFVALSSVTDLYERPRPKEAEILCSVSTNRKSQDSSHSEFGSVNNIKLLFDSENTGSLQRKSIQKASIASKQAKWYVSKTLRELKTWSQMACQTGENNVSLDEWSDEDMISTSSIKDKSDCIVQQIMIQKEDNKAENVEKIERTVSVKQDDMAVKPKNILCLNKLASTTKNIQLSGFKISLGNDSDDESYPSTGSYIKVVM